MLITLNTFGEKICAVCGKVLKDNQKKCCKTAPYISFESFIKTDLFPKSKNLSKWVYYSPLSGVLCFYIKYYVVILYFIIHFSTFFVVVGEVWTERSSFPRTQRRASLAPNPYPSRNVSPNSFSCSSSFSMVSSISSVVLTFGYELWVML